jgi:hypothetical protein
VTLIYKIHTSIEEPFWNPTIIMIIILIIIIIIIIPLLTIGSNWVEFLCFLLVELLLKLEKGLLCLLFLWVLKYPIQNCMFDGSHKVSM